MAFLGPATFVLLWWLSFFIMLPLGVRNLDEAGIEVTAGTERGAPAAPRIWRKMLYAAALAGVLWLIGYTLLKTGVISLHR